jgi:hypothetical protein
VPCTIRAGAPHGTDRRRPTDHASLQPVSRSIASSLQQGPCRCRRRSVTRTRPAPPTRRLRRMRDTRARGVANASRACGVRFSASADCKGGSSSAASSSHTRHESELSIGVVDRIGGEICSTAGRPVPVPVLGIDQKASAITAERPES